MAGWQESSKHGWLPVGLLRGEPRAGDGSGSHLYLHSGKNINEME